MVFIGGPRQCGKTTLAEHILRGYPSGRYLNWDSGGDRKVIRSEGWSENSQLIVLDELHKMKRWKTWIKGVYDTSKNHHRFLVTGSARLDVYRRGGDSLMGRYHYWRLHPFSLSELPSKMENKEALKRLMAVGGFPEPFLDGSETQARRWRQERYDRIIKDDIRDLENLNDSSTLSLLVDLLRSRVGQTIVVKNLAEDLGKSPVTISRWIQALEKMYLLFIVRAYAGNLARALSKPFKVYFFDNADVDGDEGARFENLVASHLLKKCHYLQDRDGYRYELCFARDKEKREVDFVVLRDRKVTEVIEAKWAVGAASKNLIYFAERFKTPRATQIVGTWNKAAHIKGGLHICGPWESLRSLEG
jgi:hypothetical protein